MQTRQELIDAIEAKVAAGATVVASVVTMISAFVEEARAAKDDPEELEGVLAALEEQNQRLAAAVASGTQAEDEVPAPQTGGEDSGEATTGGEDSPAGGEGEDSINAGEGGDTLEGGGA